MWRVLIIHVLSWVIYHYIFNQSPIDVQSGYSQFGAITSKIAINIVVDRCSHFSSCLSGSRMAGPYGMYMLNFWRICQAGFQNSCAISHSRQQCVRTAVWHLVCCEVLSQTCWSMYRAISLCLEFASTKLICCAFLECIFDIYICFWSFSPKFCSFYIKSLVSLLLCFETSLCIKALDLD